MYKAVNEGPLTIGDIVFDCAVLEDGTRVVSEQKFMAAMGMYRSGALSTRRKTAASVSGAPIPLFLAHKNLKPYAERHLGGVHFEPVKYRTIKGSTAHGIKAELIPKVCEIWIDANTDGVLGASQEKVATKANILIRGFAHVGIIALVDEATGYQEIRDRKALNKILDKYLLAEHAKWAKRFPDDFYKEIFRLREWVWQGMKVNRPSIVGRYTNDFVWDRLAPGVRGELERLNPKNETGSRRARHHQWLTSDVGHPALQKHLSGVMALMRASSNWDHFRRLLQRAYPKVNTNLEIPLDD